MLVKARPHFWTLKVVKGEPFCQPIDDDIARKSFYPQVTKNFAPFPVFVKIRIEQCIKNFSLH
jgi:hypothetical protein